MGATLIHGCGGLSMVDQALKHLPLAVDGEVDHVSELVPDMGNCEATQRLRSEEMDRCLAPGRVIGALEVLIIGPTDSRRVSVPLIVHPP